MKYKIGLFGSASGDLSALPKAVQIGEEFGKYADKVIMVTGACAGLPYAAAQAASAKGVEVWGYASSLDEVGLKAEYPNHEVKVYSKIFYVPPTFPFAKVDRVRKKYRNIISTANCDAGIFISGLWGTLNEFTNLIDFQKTAGILTDTGGIADELPDLTQKIHKAGQGQAIFDDDPGILVKKILDSLITS